MERNFFEMVRERARKIDSLLCVGLDPVVGKQTDDETAASAIVEANGRIIEATVPFTACYKPNIAFYEAFGPAGLSALKKTMTMIPPDVPVILDAKRGDIGSTADAYARAAFEQLGAHAITLSPYLGRDSADSFLAYENRCVFLLCRTSNPSGSAFQNLPVHGEPLYLSIADECVSWSERVGLVVAANELDVLSRVRERHPSVWFLAPGIGVQGGEAEASVAAGADGEGMGILPVVARGISGAKDPSAAARSFRDSINLGRERARKRSRSTPGSSSGTRDERKALLSGLIDLECFRVGEFVLKSGKKSPFYIDLRRIISSPSLLSLTAKAYASLMNGLRADRIAAVPMAALAFGAAASLETGIPLIFPRLTAKDHGTGNAIEGAFKSGERVVLLDDLITTGKSKLEAVEILRANGLVVTDLIVLLERGVQGRKDMEAAGIRLHAYALVDEFLDICEEKGLIDGETKEGMVRYAREE